MECVMGKAHEACNVCVCVCIVVKNRNAETLWEEIITHIAPGTIIMSDSWGAYTCIEKRGKKRICSYDSQSFKKFCRS